jgi:hypothetical protein
MKRHYYLSDDLDDLEFVERDLEHAGLATRQIHVLSEDAAGVELHHINGVQPVLKKDVLHSTEIGATIGVILAALMLLLAWLSGMTPSHAWFPTIFLALIVLGFCTWEGGLIGIGEPYVDFRRFRADLKAGKHILLVDVECCQESILRRVVKQHPKLKPAGDGTGTPR